MCLIWPNSPCCMLDCNIVFGITLYFIFHVQTPPPLRSTVTGPLISRVSSAVFNRMARRLLDTCPFFTALISCRDSREESQYKRTHTLSKHALFMTLRLPRSLANWDANCANSNILSHSLYADDAVLFTIGLYDS